MIIYKITNQINGKIYIGQTTRTLEERIAEHRSSKDTCIGQAIHKYEWENFRTEIIEECKSLEELNEREMYYNSIAPNGYNLTEGGKNCILSDLAKLKISIANKGRKHSKETCKKISKIKKGTKLSAETRAKMSAKRKGKPKSDSTRAKMTLAQAKNRKKVRCIETGEIFKSICDANKKLNIPSGGISSTCNGLRKTAGGLHWEFVQNN